MADKLLSQDTNTVLLVPAIEIAGVPQLIGASGVAPIDAPTTAILNVWQAITSRAASGSGAGGNITAAIKDDMKLSPTDSDTDGDRVINAVGQAAAPTIKHFQAVLNLLRDLDPTDAASVFNLAKDLVRAADIPYIIVHRVGKAASEPFAVGDEINLYYAWTDNAVPGYTDGGNQTLGETFVPKNVRNNAYTLAA